MPEGTLVTIRRQIAHVELRHGGWLALGRYGGGFPRDACLGHVAWNKFAARLAARGWTMRPVDDVARGNTSTKMRDHVAITIADNRVSRTTRPERGICTRIADTIRHDDTITADNTSGGVEGRRVNRSYPRYTRRIQTTTTTTTTTTILEISCYHTGENEHESALSSESLPFLACFLPLNFLLLSKRLGGHDSARCFPRVIHGVIFALAHREKKNERRKHRRFIV